MKNIEMWWQILWVIDSQNPRKIIVKIVNSPLFFAKNLVAKLKSDTTPYQIRRAYSHFSFFNPRAPSSPIAPKFSPIFRLSPPKCHLSVWKIRPLTAVLKKWTFAKQNIFLIFSFSIDFLMKVSKILNQKYPSLQNDISTIRGLCELFKNSN